jgi:hypothetical protein
VTQAGRSATETTHCTIYTLASGLAGLRGDPQAYGRVILSSEI